MAATCSGVKMEGERGVSLTFLLFKFALSVALSVLRSSGNHTIKQQLVLANEKDGVANMRFLVKKCMIHIQ